MRPLNIDDIAARAKQVLPDSIWEFVKMESFDGITVRRNRAALDAVALRPRYLVDIWNRDLSTTVLGKKIDLPVMIASPGQHRVAHHDGEVATARAAASAGTVMLLSTYSTYSIEEVARGSTGRKWFQLFHRVNYETTEMLVRRAEEAGYEAIALTVCVPAAASMDLVNVRNPYVRPQGLELRNFVGEEANLGMVSGSAEASQWNPTHIRPLTWGELDWLRSLTSLPLVIKGIATAEDARLCVEHGVDGIIVSNHGGTAFDGMLSSIETLPEVVEAVQGRAEVYLDSGIRRGADVFRALALGAKAVLFGRPIFWGLAADGEAGVKSVLDILRDELDVAMAYCGVNNVQEITRGHVALPGEEGWVQNP